MNKPCFPFIISSLILLSCQNKKLSTSKNINFIDSALILNTGNVIDSTYKIYTPIKIGTKTNKNNEWTISNDSTLCSNIRLRINIGKNEFNIYMKDTILKNQILYMDSEPVVRNGLLLIRFTCVDKDTIPSKVEWEMGKVSSSINVKYPNMEVKYYLQEPLQKSDSLSENSVNSDCNISPIKGRKEYNPEKRLNTLYLLWNINRMELLEYEKQGNKLGQAIINNLKNNRNNQSLKEIDKMIEKTRENKNNLLDVMPKMDELENLHELMYCYYLHSIDYLIELRKIIDTNEDEKNIFENVKNYIQNTTTDDDKKMSQISNELISIDEKYGLSKIHVQK